MTCCRSTITSPAPLKLQRRYYSGLGYRPSNYKPDMRDYQAYVEIRQRFMSSPRGRAALLYGGIVGRLAKSEASMEEALRGPSDDALVEGMCLWDGRSPFAYWDDCLTQQEIDLICGVYHVATGDGHFNNEQTATLSWWPRPPAFAASGLNIGWWTPMWESWYEKRLRQLESGTAVLASHAQWKHNIKLERKAPPLTDALEKCATKILAVLRS
ncbi:hypothetical protein DFH06DRAFT_983954 [Mycena polygramma]|nr:hypothetical protein DFH06DRAFT_985475 [Mycena polygramma]KAJ7666821.1 hypothetical protein DFH06DRAFT_983954 [Mycena polygramma]